MAILADDRAMSTRLPHAGTLQLTRLRIEREKSSRQRGELTMRTAVTLAAMAALWVQPAKATALWTFSVQAFTTGVTQFQGPDGVPVTIPVEMPLNFGIRVQAFTDTGNLSTYTATPPPYYDPTPLGGRYPLISGSLSLINGSITGTNFSYQGGPAQFGPCLSCVVAP
jgi:hypothetical protein